VDDDLLDARFAHLVELLDGTHSSSPPASSAVSAVSSSAVSAVSSSVSASLSSPSVKFSSMTTMYSATVSKPPSSCVTRTLFGALPGVIWISSMSPI